MNLFGSEFGLSVVNAGQRQVNDKAELVVNSTKGGFTLSGAGSSLLGVATKQMGYKNFVLGSCPRITIICTSQILCRFGCVSKVGD